MSKIYFLVMLFPYMLSCKKEQKIEEFDGFKNGKYCYDLVVNDIRYDDFLFIHIRTDTDTISSGFFSIEEEVLEIRSFDYTMDSSLPDSIIGRSNFQFRSSDDFVWTRNGLYKRKDCNTGSWFEENEINYIYFPNIVHYESDDLPIASCSETVLQNNKIVNRDRTVYVNDNNYQVYEISLHRYYENLKWNQHIFVDQNVGVIAYENYDTVAPYELISKIELTRIEPED